MADVLVKVIGAAAIKGRDCGNGVLVDHGGGWSTQYCHMRRGSVAVRPGQMVKAGAALGLVGLSGETEFAHLHITVRQDGRIVDPFVYGAPPSACGGGVSLWAADAGEARAYHAPEVLNSGFAAEPVTLAMIEDGGIAPPAGTDAPALVASARAIGLSQGDILTLQLADPQGRVLAHSATPPMNRAKDEFMIYARLRRPPEGWSAGGYTAMFQVLRAGRVVAERRFGLTLAPAAAPRP